MFETSPFFVRQTFRGLHPAFVILNLSLALAVSLCVLSPSFFFLPLSYPLYSFFSTSLLPPYLLPSSPSLSPSFFSFSPLRPLSSFFFLTFSVLFFLLFPIFFILSVLLFFPSLLFLLFSLSFSLFTPLLFLPSPSFPFLSSFSLLYSPYFLLSFFFPLSSLSPLARGMTDWECGAYRRDDGWRERE